MADDTNKYIKKTLKLVSESGLAFSRSELINAVKYSGSPKTFQRVLAELVRGGLISTTGTGSGTRYINKESTGENNTTQNPKNFLTTELSEFQNIPK